MEALSTEELDTGTPFCIYHRNGENLTQLDFGPIDKNKNLFSAMRDDITAAELGALQTNFANGIAGDLVFIYEGNKETLFYEPIPNSNWVLTVLVADHLIQDQIRGVGDEMVSRSTALIGASGVVLMGFFGYMVHLIRKRSDAEIKKERQHSEDASRRAQKTEQELGTVREVAYKDALTGVKSRYAFAREELAVDEAIQEGTMEPIAVVLCDINSLKEVNDQRGHAEGDKLIKDACQLICDQYNHSPVFRIGGDEFVVLLRGHDYALREELQAAFDAQAEKNLAQGTVVVASGMAELEPTDEHLHDVFLRADKLMYSRKAQLKLMRA